MDSRDSILSKLKQHYRPGDAIPALVVPPEEKIPLVEKMTSVLTAIGGKVYRVKGWDEIANQVRSHVNTTERFINMIPELESLTTATYGQDPHLLENVVLVIMKGNFGVAENGAIWITSDLMGDRAMPFICERLALVIKEKDIVATMYDAYERIGDQFYEFGSFIAGASKTADIEQSLVLGAHGPKSMMLFLLA